MRHLKQVDGHKVQEWTTQNKTRGLIDGQVKKKFEKFLLKDSS